MYSLNIKAKQKRWVTEESGSNLFNVFTRIEELSVTDGAGAGGSVGLQPEMFFNEFPPAQELRFDNGIPAAIAEYSVKPYRMLMEKDTTIAGGGTGVIRISDNYLRQVDTNPAFTSPRAVTITFLAGSDVYYEWSIVMDATTISGTADYGTPTLMYADLISSGLTIYADARPTECPEDFSGSPDFVGTILFAGEHRIALRGSWQGISYDDASVDPLDNPGFKFTRKDGATMLFTFGRDGSAVDVEIPWASLSGGEWVSIPDPADQTLQSGVEVKLGFADTHGIVAIPKLEFSFEGAVLDSADAQTAMLEDLIFKRPVDIYDLQGSLLNEVRVTELSRFYRAPRFIRLTSGQVVLYTLQEVSEDTWEWAPFTGSISTSNAPDVRSFTAKFEATRVEAADDHAVSIINMLAIFKDHYNTYMNETFSTDTDEYPDKEEEFDI